MPLSISVRCGEEDSGEKENEEQKDRAQIFGPLGNNAWKNVFPEYGRLMEGNKCDMDGEECSTEKKHEKQAYYFKGLMLGLWLFFSA